MSDPAGLAGMQTAPHDTSPFPAKDYSAAQTPSMQNISLREMLKSSAAENGPKII